MFLTEQGYSYHILDGSEVLKLNGQLQDLQDKITNRVAGILMALDSKVASLKDGLANLAQEVEKATANDIPAARITVCHFTSKT